jgi:tetratricopeptide (TPR) repeat protein
MVDFGIKIPKIFVTDNLKEANEILESEKVHYVFTTLEVGDESVIDNFLNAHLQACPNRLNGGFYVFTEDNSLSAACALLETEIDGLVTKPFTIKSIMDTLVPSFEAKIKPTAVSKKIEGGKELLFKEDFEQAIEFLEEAKDLDKNSADSNFYLGNAKDKTEKEEEAFAIYNEGIEKDPENFKCLNALVDYHMNHENDDEAYSRMSKILEKYPLNPSRIPTLVSLSVKTQNYQDIISFSSIFEKLPKDDPELNKYMSAGLAICGRYLITNDDKSKGMKSLELASKTCANNAEIAKSLAKSYLLAEEEDKVGELVTKLLEDFPDDLEIPSVEVAALFETDKWEEAMKKGNDLLEKGYNKAPKIHEYIIRSAVKLGLKDNAVNDLVFEAKSKCPDSQDLFESLIKE